MNLKRYQWVGLLAGFLLFSGSWLMAYYNNSFWAILTILLVGFALWSAMKVERRVDTRQHLIYGLTAGLLAGVVARILGMMFTSWAFDKWGGVKPVSSYAELSDVFRSVLNGGVGATLTLLVLSTAFGGFLALLEPDQKSAKLQVKKGKK